MAKARVVPRFARDSRRDPNKVTAYSQLSEEQKEKRRERVGLDRGALLHEQADLIDHNGNPAMLWMRYDGDDDGGYRGRHVVHGHEAVGRGPILKDRRTNLDTYAWYTGRLVVGVFDDDRAGGPIDLIEVTGPSMSALAMKERQDA